MKTDVLEKHDRFWLVDQASLSTCIFCGSQLGNNNFKGKCVCDDCLGFVKEIM